MRMTARRLVFTAVALAATAAAALPAGASATGTPDPGDPRATAFSGNLAWDHRDSCRTAGLTGTAYEKGLQSTQTSTHLTITGLNGYAVTGVVVKGANAYNVYPAAKLGALVWADLHSPLLSNKGAAELPAISHWFFCATEGTPTTTTTTTTTTSTQSTTGATTTTTAPTTTGATTTESAGQSTTPSTTGQASTTGEPSATTTTTAPVAAVSGSDDDLASTGFGSLWLLFAGLALVAAGAVVVASPKLRGLLRR